MRRWAAFALSAAAAACVTVPPSPPKVVEVKTVQSPELERMVRSAAAGPLQVDSVVYKPKLYPLSGLLARLARGEFKKAVTRLRLRYERSTVDDKALDALLRRGFIPVLVVVRNTSASAVDAGALRLSLADDDFALAPLANDRLPQEFRSLDPKAVAANAYNTSVVVAGAAVVLGVIYLEVKAGANEALLPPIPMNDNEVLNPVTKTTSIDYNGLLFKPGLVGPGETRRGLLFFKARGVDWSQLNLEASLP